MWVDGTFDLELDSRGVAALRVSWLFDEFNSADMIFMFDEDLDGELSEAEQRTIQSEAFGHLAEIDYFIVAYAGDRKLDVAEATSFQAEIADGRLRYAFTVPFRLRWADMTDAVLAFFDQSYYIDFLSDPGRARYAAAGHEVRLTEETLHLQSEGWGTIRVPALKVAAR
jgi:ABC-type uncharacterized transport system substrate-binding protein